ncbi:hypothetical protein GCM10011399_03500 [Subtercola lobariae]|uniref:Uncharacterized protein n=1 Tax=Subtercola lobariae TaxID=1588641 RepID=A0A917ETX2_9MICO|nr:hypothetical protein GCM10011399_03500 [Subtercola lobariae]
MATGISQKSPVAFTGPNLSLLPVGIPDLAVAGATRNFDPAYPIGNAGDAVTSWLDAAVSGTALTVAGSTMVGATAPILATDDGVRFFVRFKKASSASLGQALARVQPHTMFTVARWQSVPTVLEAATGSGVGTTVVQGNSVGTAFRTYAGTTLAVATALGTGWHVLTSVSTQAHRLWLASTTNRRASAAQARRPRACSPLRVSRRRSRTLTSPRSPITHSP